MRWWLFAFLLGCGSDDKPKPQPLTPAGSAPREVSPPPPSPTKQAARSIALPKVAGPGYEPIDDRDAMVVVATRYGLVVDGQAIEAISEGHFDPDAIEGGSHGLRLARLGTFTENSLRVTPKARALLMFDREHSFRLLVMTMYTMSKAGMTRFELVAETDAGLVSAPITLPAAPASAPSAPRGLGMIVTFDDDQLRVWSTSGKHGSIAEPKARIAYSDPKRLAALSAVLLAIPDRDREISLTPAELHQVQLIAEVLGAVRETPDDKPLFADVLLSMAIR